MLCVLLSLIRVSAVSLVWVISLLDRSGQVWSAQVSPVLASCRKHWAGGGGWLGVCDLVTTLGTQCSPLLSSHRGMGLHHRSARMRPGCRPGSAGPGLARHQQKRQHQESEGGVPQQQLSR